MSLEIQTRVLATLMLVGNPKDLLIQESILRLNDELFADLNCRELLTVIKKQFYARKPFDFITLSDLVSKNIYPFMMDICPQAWSTNLLLTDIKFLEDSSRKSIIAKRLNRLNLEFSKETFPDKSCELAIDACFEIGSLGTVNDTHVFTNNAITPIIPSGLKTLDNLLSGGFKNRSLITIAGRSGMGKTGFAVHLAHNIASNHEHSHVLFYSLEMTASDIYEKQLSSILQKQVAEADRHERVNAVARSCEIPFTIHEKPLASIEYIETTARLTATKTPISVIVVDYIGLVQNRNRFESHALKQADIALRLSALALELNCIVIALTQVNRDYSTRADKVPVTSDAADSSGSERSSSYWLGIYRPYIDDESQLENDFVVKCRKNRFGNTWTAYFNFNNATFGETNQKIYNAIPFQKKGYENYKKEKSSKS
jgi:RecA/RadA recombinase